MMKTYQDFLQAKQGNLKEFLLDTVDEHKMSAEYKMAQIAEQYDRRRNVTIMKYQKYLYTMTGQKIPDVISPNHKLCSNYFHKLTRQLVQYLLGNGVTFAKSGVKEKLGETFDTMLQKAGKYATIGGISYGFWDYNKMKVFKFTEFAPYVDEENGSLRAGVRHWQLAPDKPLRMTLYEEDGYTEYKKTKDGKVEEIAPKRPYKLIVKSTIADGTEIYGGENYPSFPIVPFYANEYHQSELTGMRPSIDAYDLIQSGFGNDLDGNLLYWVIQNAGGMDDVDIARALERIKMLGAAVSSEEGTIEPREIKIPYEAREIYLKRLDEDMYRDYGALKVEKISGHTTIPEIEAAYLGLDEHADEFEYFCIDFVQRILKLQGIDATPQFKRNRISNRTEETSMVLQSASYLDDETILKHLPFLTNDEYEHVKRAKEKEEADRYAMAEQISQGNGFEKNQDEQELAEGENQNEQETGQRDDERTPKDRKNVIAKGKKVK